MTATEFNPGQGGHAGGPLEIRARNINFNLEDALDTHWHSDNAVLTAFFNGLSLMFPEGERYFMDSVRNFSDQVEDPTLKSHVKGFLHQEAVHSREHVRYNKAVGAKNRMVKPIERGMKKGLGFARRFPKSWQLADTCASEHFTAILADALLASPGVTAGMKPEMRELWQWHAVEETEHKAVAYDVFHAAHKGPKAYFIRIGAMMMSTFGFTLGAIAHMLMLLHGEKQLTNWKDWGGALKYFFVSPGFFWIAAKSYFSYYRPGYHPWDHKNAHHIDAWNNRHESLRGDDGTFAGAIG